MCAMQPTPSGSTVMSFPPIPFELQVISSVLLKDKVYITGIATDNDNLSKSRQVQVYSLIERNWTTLQLAPNYYASLAVVDHHITLIGGRDAETGNITNLLSTWSEDEHRWKHMLPPMPTRRSASGVCQHDGFLLVTGGTGVTTEGEAEAVSSVDVYSFSTRSWSSPKALELPVTLRSHHLTVSGEYIYLAGGATVFPAPREKENLFNYRAWRARWSDMKDAIRKPFEPEKSVWMRISDPPFLRPTVIASMNSLISVGGVKEFKLQRAIYQFVEGNSGYDWIEVGRMSVEKYRHAVVSIGGHGTALFIAGGYVKGGPIGDEEIKRSSTVEVVLL